MTIDIYSRPNTVSIIMTDPSSLKQPRLTSLFKRVLEILTYYETPILVRFESKWIASFHSIAKLLLATICIVLMFQRSPYQIYDRSPISAVTIKVQPSSNYSRNSSIMRNFTNDNCTNDNCTQSLYDVHDFVLPAIENSAVSITTRITETKHVLKSCKNTTIGENQKNYSSDYAALTHECNEPTRCVLPPFYRPEYENKTIIEKTKLCWFKLPSTHDQRNYQILDYILFIKHYVEFPQFRFEGNNLIHEDIHSCEYGPGKNQSCLKFRILKILETVVNNNTEDYKTMFDNGSLLEIRINWECNIGIFISSCQRKYEFKRLDYDPNTDNPFYFGSSFRTTRYFFEPNSSELYRVRTKTYNLHIIISVTGVARKFDPNETLLSIGSFVGIYAIGRIVCDLIVSYFTHFKRAKYSS